MSIGTTLGAPWENLGVRMLTDDELLAKSSGEVKKPETLNYRTLKPEPDGLFDVVVFTDRDEWEQLFIAGMDVVWSVTPATSRFGHVELAQPIVHPFYATHGVEELAAQCGWPADEVRRLVFQDMVLHNGVPTPLKDVLEPHNAVTGAAAFAEILTDPEQFLVRRVLVAPVVTRPMAQFPDGGWATSHVNDLYRRTINRNNRLRRLLELNAPAVIIINEQRMLQEAACQLCFNGFDENKVLKGVDGEPLVSLFALAQREASYVEQALTGQGPARGVRALRVFEAMGFGLGAMPTRRHAPKTEVDLSVVDSPVPIPSS